MYFGLTEEQELLQETVRGFVANECPPQRVREIFDGGAGHDPEVWAGLVEMGLTGLIVPEQHEGAGMELLELALVAEQLGAGAVPGPFIGHSLACIALSLAGSEAQQAHWLPKLAAGEAVGTLALAESPVAWEPDRWALECKDDELTGTKLFVANAESVQLFVVGTRGGGLALVDAEADGIRITSMDGVDRTRPISRIDFEGARCEPLSSSPVAANRVLDAGRILLAADSFGVATELVRMSTEYAKTRMQFGFPIGQFQAVKHQLARMATDIEPTRSLFWFAGHAFDHLRDESQRSAALAKAHITDRAMSAARTSVELWGGLGFTWECDVQIWFKRAMFNRALLGTPEHLRDRCAELAGW